LTFDFQVVFKGLIFGVWINASLKDDDDIQIFRDKWNHYAVQQTNSEKLLISSPLQ